MTVSVFDYLPEEASVIRDTVFIKEQGFESEFDDIDLTASHLVAYDNGIPIGTCRVFSDGQRFVLGRLAVLKEYRGKKAGAFLLSAAERLVAEKGGKELFLHAQTRVRAFYEKQGFEAFGEIDFDEDCPHIWMKNADITVNVWR